MPNLFRYGKVALVLTLALSLLFLDFLSKAYVYHILSCCEGAPSAVRMGPIPVFLNLFGVDFWIYFAANKGAAWGLFNQFQIPLLILRMLVIAGLICYLFFGQYASKMFLPLVLIITGALGNVIDFFLYGFVVDFLLINFWGYHFPVFNFADVCITIGVIWLCLIQFWAPKHIKV